MDALNAISVPAPQFSKAAALHTLQTKFDLQGELLPLVSERDQNFRVVTADGQRFIFKIANASEPQLATDFQIAALLHIEQQQCPVATPRVLRTVDGDVATWMSGNEEDSHPHRCRVVSFVAGELLSNVTLSPALVAHFGTSAAQLDLALAKFDHDDSGQVLLWDLQRAGALREILDCVNDAPLQAALRACLDDFDARVKPALPRLRKQVIHADMNPDNVLTSSDNRVAGFIDFGDMLRAPLVMEVAIACSYLRPRSSDGVLAWVNPFVAAYHRVLPLQDNEIELLFDLLRARLVATISILRWRAADRGSDDVYSQQNLEGEADAASFLFRLAEFGRHEFNHQVKKYIKNN